MDALVVYMGLCEILTLGLSYPQRVDLWTELALQEEEGDQFSVWIGMRKLCVEGNKIILTEEENIEIKKKGQILNWRVEDCIKRLI